MPTAANPKTATVDPSGGLATLTVTPVGNLNRKR